MWISLSVAAIMGAMLHTSSSHSGDVYELILANPTALDDFDTSAYPSSLGFFAAVLVAVIVPSYVYVKSLLPVMRKGKFTLWPARAFSQTVQDYRMKIKAVEPDEKTFKKTGYGTQRHHRWHLRWHRP